MFNMQHPLVGGYEPAAGGAAPRHRAWASTCGARSASLRNGAAVQAQSTVSRAPVGLRPGLSLRDGRVRPGRVRAPCSTCTAGATVTATAFASSPTAGRSSWRWPRSPTRRRAA
jgi:hypothetical protein